MNVVFAININIWQQLKLLGENMKVKMACEPTNDSAKQNALQWAKFIPPKEQFEISSAVR